MPMRLFQARSHTSDTHGSSSSSLLPISFFMRKRDALRLPAVATVKLHWRGAGSARAPRKGAPAKLHTNSSFSPSDRLLIALTNTISSIARRRRTRTASSDRRTRRSIRAAACIGATRVSCRRERWLGHCCNPNQNRCADQTRSQELNATVHLALSFTKAGRLVRRAALATLINGSTTGFHTSL